MFGLSGQTEFAQCVQGFVAGGVPYEAAKANCSMHVLPGAEGMVMDPLVVNSRSGGGWTMEPLVVGGSGIMKTVGWGLGIAAALGIAYYLFK